MQSIPQLQNLIKRDSKSYTNEFLAQYRHFEAKLEIFSLSPSVNDSDFASLVNFISHVFNLYPEIDSVAAFPQLLMNLLADFHQQLHPDVRKSMVSSLILIRNKNMLSTEKLLSLFFTLFRCHDKQLRTLLHTHIVSDIKNANAKSKNNSLNKTLQNFMYTMLKDSNDIAAKKSLEVMIDLYKKNIWNDQKTVNVIADACFSNVPKILATALNFFLGHDREVDEDEDDDTLDLIGIKHTITINKKKRSRKTQYDKALASIKRKERSKNKSEVYNFSALHLINDPQGFTEKLFSRLRATHSNHNIKFELRLLMLNLITRMVGIHKLLLLGVYEYIIPFLKPAQREVTSMIAYIAQASHELVPPDALEPVLQTISNHFIWSNCSGEVICAGLNGLREICTRCPLAMPETLLSSMIDDFKRHHEKGVGMAIRGLIGLYRDFNPELLKKRDRGKAVAVAEKRDAPKYGERTILDTVDGLEFFSENSSEEEDMEEEENTNPGEGWEGWEIDEEQGSGAEESDGFEDIDDDEDISESEDAEKSTKVSTSPLDEAEKKQTAKQMAMERILTDEDFARLRKIKAKKEAERMAGMKRSKVSLKDIIGEGDSDDAEKEFVDPMDILMGTKRKQNYEQRMESIMTGREGREKFGSKKSSEERGSSTNKEKSKKKAFVMMKHKRSVSGKAKRSLREQQKILRQHITKQKKQY